MVGIHGHHHNILAELVYDCVCQFLAEADADIVFFAAIHIKHFCLLACDVLSCGVIAITSTLILTIVALFFGYRMQGNVLIFMGVWLLTMLSMFSIGLLVASLCRTTKSMNVATSLLYFPMLLFSGATIPAEVFPESVYAISKWMPLGIGIDALKKVSIGCFDGIWMAVGVLSIMAIVCMSIAVKSFRWE